MKLNKKEKVYEFIAAYSSEYKHDEYPKFTTNFLSQKLGMQRTNLSSILNQLVKEGKLMKENGRPVLYQFIDLAADGEYLLQELIGYDQSLKEAVAIAKAAILYPEGKPMILIKAEKGSGVKYFAQKVFQFAVKSGVVKNSTMLLLFDCHAYKENEAYGKKVLFGDQEKEGLLDQSQNGMLLIQNIDLLPGYEQEMIFSWKHRGIILFHTDTDEKKQNRVKSLEHMDYTLYIPSLKERTMEERFQLVQKFFQEEARNLKRNIEVDSSILNALLLYDVRENIRGLKTDIHTGCANCYVRTRKSRNRFIEIQLADFPIDVRKGVLYYRVRKEEVDAFISKDYKYAFTDATMLKKQKRQEEQEAKSIYQSLDHRKKELKKQHITEEEVDAVVSTELYSNFAKYCQELSKKVQSRKDLEKFVSDKLIYHVEEFLKLAGQTLEQTFDEKMLFVICLHMNSCFVRVTTKQRISNEEIQQLVVTYPYEYQLSKDFIKSMEQEFGIHLNVDEIMFLMLFLIQNKREVIQRVVTLVAMHGSTAATSIAETANAMANESTTYAYDLALDKDIKAAYDELKQMVISIHQGKGILLIYDMGSIRTMAESIAIETGIPIEFLEVPITLLCIAGSNQASEDKDLNDISQYLQMNFEHIQHVRDNRNKNILVLLSSAAGNITLARHHIDRNMEWKDMEVVSIISEDMNDIYNQIGRISRKGKITGIIGDSDPGLAQYPFTTISHLLEMEKIKVEELWAEPEEALNTGVSEAFEYLKDQFTQIDMDKMEIYLMNFIHQLEYVLDMTLNEDQQIGLIIHIVCLIDRINHDYTPSINFIASDIMKEHKELVMQVKKLLEPMEHEFHVYINDAEIATIISIIRK